MAEEKSLRHSLFACGLGRWLPFIANGFHGGRFACGAQQCGKNGYRGGIFDPFRQSLPFPGAARVVRAGLADYRSFLITQRCAARFPLFCLIGIHLFRFRMAGGFSRRGASPPSDDSAGGGITSLRCLGAGIGNGVRPRPRLYGRSNDRPVTGTRPAGRRGPPQRRRAPGAL